MTEDDLIREISRLMASAPASSGQIIKRLRFAVSPDEFGALRRLFLARDGYFASRVRDCPLVVEQMPDDPAFLVEIAREPA